MPKTNIDNFCLMCGISIKNNRKYCSRSCRNKYDWQNPEYRERKIQQFSERRQSMNKKAVERWKELYETDEDFRKKETQKRLDNGFHKIARENPEKMREIAKNARSRMVHTEEQKDNLSRIAAERVKDPQDNFGTRKNYQQEYKNILMRSGLEVKFAQELDKRNIVWEYEPTTFKFDSGKRYTPDFFLPKYSIYVEIKPDYFQDEKAQEKCFCLREQYSENIVMLNNITWTYFLDSLS